MNRPLPTSSLLDRQVAFSNAERYALLNDIARIGLILGKSQTTPPLALQTSSPSAETPQERILLLQSLATPLEAALSTLWLSPDSRIQRKSQTTLLAKTQGSAKTLKSIAQNSKAAAAFQAEDSSATIGENRTSLTLNTPANRLVLMLLQQWEREANALQRCAKFWEATKEEEFLRASTTFAHKAAQSIAALQGLKPLAESEWGELESNGVPLRWSPPYRALYDIGRQLRGGLSFDWSAQPFLEAATLEEWRLYEIWAFLKVIEVLTHLGWSRVGGDAVTLRESRLRLELERGRESRIRFSKRGETLELLYQPFFPSANQSGGETVSRTHAMQPDIGIWLRGSLYLLDPKFRAYADTPQTDDALLADLDKMHAYRDSIQRGGSPVVQEAWCLFPGSPHTETQIIAYPASTKGNPFGNAGVGALMLRPHLPHSHLENLITSWEKRRDD